MPAEGRPFADEPRFVLLRAHAAADDFARDVREGLTAPRKSLPPIWFYDALGSLLFDAICFLPEYYLTRAETEVLTTFCGEIVDAFGPKVRIVELGSGAARKTRILLSGILARQGELEYVPVDVDESMLERSARELLSDEPGLRVTAVRGDFTRPSLALSLLAPSRARTIVLFLGSTIGNLDPGAATAMLRDLRASLSTGDALLLGADLRKERHIIEPAYDDALGLTAAFNLNLLARINRELGGDFDLHAFRHVASYDRARGCMDMYLASRNAQRVRIDALDLNVGFDEGETIHTESSYKHDPDTLDALASAAGFTVERSWTDARGWFTDVLMIAS